MRLFQMKRIFGEIKMSWKDEIKKEKLNEPQDIIKVIDKLLREMNTDVLFSVYRNRRLMDMLENLEIKGEYMNLVEALEKSQERLKGFKMMLEDRR